jgi:hypothetical protein
MSKIVCSIVFLSVIGCGRSDPPPKAAASGTPSATAITASQAIRIAEEFIRANGYTDYSPEDVSKLDVDLPEKMTEEDQKFLKKFLAGRSNSIKPRAYGWRKGRRNDPKGWTVGFELVKPLKNDPSIGQAVEMDEHGSDVWVEHMGFDLKSLSDQL